MKKIIYSFFMVSSAFTVSCMKDNNPILDNPDKRLVAALDANKTLLLSATNGWKAIIYPKGGKGFSYYFQFTADGKVKMLSDFDTASATELSESTYRLKALQRPTLIFDSYNYIHLLSDPDSSVSGSSKNGTGLTSDFEFVLTEQKGDTLNMEGIFNNNRMTMVKLSASEAQVILAGGFKTMLDNNATYIAANKNPYIAFDDGTKAAIVFNTLQKTINISYVNNNNALKNQTLEYAVGIDRLYLSDLYKYGTSSFKELLYDETAKTYYVMLGDKKVNIENSPTPIIPFSFLFGPKPSYIYNFITIPIKGLPSGVTSGFTEVYDQMTKLFSKVKRTVLMTTFLLKDNNSFSVNIEYQNENNKKFEATAVYGYTRKRNVITLDNNPILYGDVGDNWSTRKDEIKPLADYMLTGPFRIDWVISNDPDAKLIGGLYRVADAGSFIYGNCY